MMRAECEWLFLGLLGKSIFSNTTTNLVKVGKHPDGGPLIPYL